jgi:hypothetical protein
VLNTPWPHLLQTSLPSLAALLLMTVSYLAQPDLQQ